MVEMAKDLQTDPDRQLLAEVVKLGETVTFAQLVRWRQAGLVPQERERPGRPKGGSRSSYPDGTAEQVVTLVRFLRARKKVTLDEAILPLFLAGFRIREDVLKAKLLGRYDQIKASSLHRAREQRVRSATPDKRRRGRPSRLDMAEAAALADIEDMAPLRRQALLSRVEALTRHNVDTWGEVEPTVSLLLSALTQFNYTFLFGTTDAEADQVTLELLYLVGLEKGLPVLAAAFGEAPPDVVLQAVPGIINAFSLPALVKTVRRASLAELESMRDEFLAKIGTPEQVTKVMPVGVGERAPGHVLTSEDAATVAYVIPAMPRLKALARAVDGQATTSAAALDGQPEAPALAFLDDPAAAELFRKMLRRKARRTTRERLHETLSTDRD